MPLFDLQGQRFGRLLVTERGGTDRFRQAIWRCRCDCGSESFATTGTLRKGHTRSCGCLKAGVKTDGPEVAKRVRSNLKNHTGQTFGRLTVLSYAGKCKWNCRCKCGSEKVVSGGSLRNGCARSCGCLGATFHLKHGQSHTSEYVAWGSMIQRCTNENSPAYQGYGGRGITVCQRWRDSFVDFLADVGPRPPGAHSLDRIDNDGAYEPGNCRWSTGKQQQRNRRGNHLLTAMGQTKTIAEWAEFTGIKPATLRSRIRYGWDADRAVEPSSRPNELP